MVYPGIVLSFDPALDTSYRAARMSNILHSPQSSLAAPMLFAALSEELQAEARRHAIRREFPEGSIIQQRGDKARGFWLLESGSVAVGQFLPDGEFRAAALLGPGDSWGELAIFANRPRVVDAIARKSSEALFIPAAEFEALLARHPAAMRGLLAALSAQLQEVLDLLAGIRKGSALPRIAGMLANLARNTNDNVSVSLTQHELGELLGLSRATVNAGLREFERKGLLTRRYGQIVIEQPEQLRLISLAD